jgi:lysozyme family protein
VNFDESFHKLLGHEGGYSNHPSDPGGETMWGVTARVARANGYQGAMRDLPLSLAKTIYRKDYWMPCRCEELPPALRYPVFDAAVNSGVRQSIRWLQRAVGAKDDGIFGPMTMEAVKSNSPDVVVRRLLSQRLRFMAELPNWPAFSRGWARRIADLMEV